jgi:hypothetical protein
VPVAESHTYDWHENFVFVSASTSYQFGSVLVGAWHDVDLGTHACALGSHHVLYAQSASLAHVVAHDAAVLDVAWHAYG